MARATTIQALRNRGLSKKTAEVLADAGFTLEKLQKATLDRLKKFLTVKEAEKGKVRCPKGHEFVVMGMLGGFGDGGAGGQH